MTWLHANISSPKSSRIKLKAPGFGVLRYGRDVVGLEGECEKEIDKQASKQPAWHWFFLGLLLAKEVNRICLSPHVPCMHVHKVGVKAWMALVYLVRRAHVRYRTIAVYDRNTYIVCRASSCPIGKTCFRQILFRPFLLLSFFSFPYPVISRRWPTDRRTDSPTPRRCVRGCVRMGGWMGGSRMAEQTCEVNSQSLDYLLLIHSLTFISRNPNAYSLKASHFGDWMPPTFSSICWEFLFAGQSHPETLTRDSETKVSQAGRMDRWKCHYFFLSFFPPSAFGRLTEKSVGKVVTLLSHSSRCQQTLQQSDTITFSR